jgi:general secretion pathway protein F
LSLLVQAGTPLVQALDLARDLLPASLHAAVAAARRDMTEGQSVSAAFEAHGLSTVIARRLLRVAERTGAMGDMLERTAAFHDEDITQSIDWFVRLFEPLLMLAIGLVIGVVVLLMYAPIFELAGSLQ